MVFAEPAVAVGGVAAEAAAVEPPLLTVVAVTAVDWAPALTAFSERIASEVSAVPEMAPELWGRRVDGGELEEAAEYYRRAAKVEPRAQLAVLNLGNTMNRMARHSEAVAALSTAVRLDPSNWQASLNLGARRPRPSALRLYAWKAEAWHHRRLGNSLCAKGDLQSAVQLYQSVVRANPKCAASPVWVRAQWRAAPGGC